MGNCDTSAGMGKGTMCSLASSDNPSCCTLIDCTPAQKCTSPHLFICKENSNNVCAKPSSPFGACTCKLLNPVGRSLSGADADSIEEFVQNAPDFAKYDDGK